jgi:hypothetical protein
MRDVNRIGRICEKLRIIWTAQQAQRLGQLITNLSRLPREPGRGSDWFHRSYAPDLWNLHDEEWERLLDKEIIDLEFGAKYKSYLGEPLYLDRGWLVTRHELYED